MEDLKYAVERSDAKTPKGLVHYANDLYLGNPAHDAFVYGVASAQELVEDRIEDLIEECEKAKNRTSAVPEEMTQEAIMAKLDRLRKDLNTNSGDSSGN